MIEKESPTVLLADHCGVAAPGMTSEVDVGCAMTRRGIHLEPQMMMTNIDEHNFPLQTKIEPPVSYSHKICPGCIRSIPRVYPGSIQGVAKVLPRYSRVIYRLYPGYTQGICRVFLRYIN